MAVSYSSTSGIAYPDDLRLLKQIYDELCEENGLPPGCGTAEDLAMATMSLFSQGVFDEHDIRVSLREFLKRRSLPN